MRYPLYPQQMMKSLIPCCEYILRMCHRIGRPPISTIGFGRVTVSSLSLVPTPPANMIAFIPSSGAPEPCASQDGGFSFYLGDIALKSIQYTGGCPIVYAYFATSTEISGRASATSSGMVVTALRRAYPATECEPVHCTVPVSAKLIDTSPSAGDSAQHP